MGLMLPKVTKNEDEAEIDAIEQMGMYFCFKCLESVDNTNKSMVFCKIDAETNCKFKLSYDLKTTNNYSEMTSKIDKQAKYGNAFMKGMRTWLLKTLNGKEYSLTANFYNEEDLMDPDGFVFTCYGIDHYSEEQKLENMQYE